MSKKYKFAKDYKDARIVIPTLSVEITSKNVNDQYDDTRTYGDLIMKGYKHLSHNLEEVETEESASKKSKKPDIIEDSELGSEKGE
jgi:hypothetical protein